MPTTLQELGLGARTLIMGVLNVTPDSFSDGGLYADTPSAVARALAMMAEGADIIDIGGESTRPSTFRDSSPLPVDDELARVIPVIEALRAADPSVPISIDTYKAAVADAALKAGASIVNDISALTYDTAMAQLAASTGAPVVLMHMPGPPRSMPEAPQYTDVVRDVVDYLAERAVFARRAGIETDAIILDPGIGFGKTPQENFALIGHLRELVYLGYAVLTGVSRKSFLTKVLGDVPADDRLAGTAAAVALSIGGGADIVRVHDIAEMARVVRVADAIVRPTFPLRGPLPSPSAADTATPLKGSSGTA